MQWHQLHPHRRAHWPYLEWMQAFNKATINLFSKIKCWHQWHNSSKVVTLGKRKEIENNNQLGPFCTAMASSVGHSHKQQYCEGN